MNNEGSCFDPWRRLRLMMVALFIIWTPTLLASTPPWQSLRTVGQGEMEWLWFKLYDATFYSHSGRYQPGDKLPSVRDLAAEASVNPNTMQKAFAELSAFEL